MLGDPAAHLRPSAVHGLLTTAASAHAPAYAADEVDPRARELWALRRENRRRLASDHLAGCVVSSGRPAHLKIELTNFCNLACPMCPHHLMRRPVGYMKPALFRRIIDQAAPELEFAYLHHLGESLFHGRIGDLIRYGRSRGVAMGLSTNATYLDLRKGRLLVDSGLDFLVISLDAATPQTYERMRIGGDFATTLANVRAFIALARQQKSATQVAVQLIVTEQNRHEIERFASDWAGQVHVMIKEARDFAGQVPIPLGKKAQAAQPSLTSAILKKGDAACRMLWTELTVLWDGRVVPCANVFEHENILGDLNTQTLDEVFNGQAMRALRTAHLEDNVAAIPVCATCSRHRFEHADFVAVDQLTQRLRNYLRNDLRPRPGLS